MIYLFISEDQVGIFTGEFPDVPYHGIFTHGLFLNLTLETLNSYGLML